LDSTGKTFVTHEVGVVVAVAVVAEERDRDPAERVAPVRHLAADHGLQRCAGRGEHVGALVATPATARRTPGVAVGGRPLDRTDDAVDEPGTGGPRVGAAAPTTGPAAGGAAAGPLVA